MKNKIALLSTSIICFILLSFTSDNKRKQEIFYVNNLKELLNVLGDNRIIYLNSDINITEDVPKIAPLNAYNSKIEYKELLSLSYEREYYELKTVATTLDKLDSLYRDKFVSDRSQYDNAYSPTEVELHIKNTTNLSIIGKEKIQIITESGGPTSTLSFTNNKQLVLENLKIFNRPPPKEDKDLWGFSETLSFTECESVKINKCDIGEKYTNEGISAISVSFLELNDTHIQKCNIPIRLTNIKNCTLNNCHIENNYDASADDNRAFSIFYIGNTNMYLNKCTIQKNSSTYLIHTDNNHDTNTVYFNKCIFRDNRIKKCFNKDSKKKLKVKRPVIISNKEKRD